MATKGVRRFTASSKMGRQIAAASSPIPPTGKVSKEVQEWNARVEAKKAKKLTARVNASHKISVDPTA